MTYFADLSPCAYGGDFLSEFDDDEPIDTGGHRSAAHERTKRNLPLPMAVGWLDAIHPFAVGPVEPDFRARLEALFDAGYSNCKFMGWHDCELCMQSPPASMPRPRKGVRHPVISGDRNITIPGQRAVYYAPELMLHYIDAHRYQPPLEFRQAVMACPPFLSEAYFLALLDILGPSFEKALARKELSLDSAIARARAKGHPPLYFGEDAVRALRRYRAPGAVLRRWLRRFRDHG